MSLKALKGLTRFVMEENLTLSKIQHQVLGSVFLLAGICLGLLAAPFTHGIAIGSHNGCNSGNQYGSDSDEEEEA